MHTEMEKELAIINLIRLFMGFKSFLFFLFCGNVFFLSWDAEGFLAVSFGWRVVNFHLASSK